MTHAFSLWWPHADLTHGSDEAFAIRFCLDHSHRVLTRWAASAQLILYDPRDRLNEILQRTLSAQILWVTDPSLLLNPFGLRRLLDSAVFPSPYAPVYLTSDVEAQRVILPYPYQDLLTYEEAAHDLASCLHRSVLPVPRLDPRCFLVPISRVHQEFPNPSAVSVETAARLLADRGGFVEPRAFFHTFLPLDQHFREDLAAMVPEEALRILDVGCSFGLYGKTLKKVRPFVFLVGVEPDPRKADAARLVYDAVYVGAFESLAIPGPFDLINCGDVLEHLSDPWEALKKMHALLRPGGTLVVSVPNMGHWTVVRGLLQGVLDYLPAGLLNRGHLRWFTETSLRTALEDAGFIVEHFQRRQPPPTPQGCVFLESLRNVGSIPISEQSLLTEAFLVRARKAPVGEPQ